MSHQGSGRTSGLLRRRSALLLSSAVSLAAVSQAQAQSQSGAEATYVDTGPGDVTYVTNSVSGMPEVAFLSTPDGDISATIGTVTASGSSGGSDRVIEAHVADANTLSLSIDTMTVQTQTATGIYTTAGTGLTDINVGSLAMNGVRGIVASGQGDVAITVGTIDINPYSGTQEPIEAIAVGRETDLDGNTVALGGSLTVDAGTIRALGNQDAYAIHADVAGDATIVVGDVVSDGEGIDVAAKGNVDVTVRENLDGWNGAMSLTGDAVSVTIDDGATVASAGGALEVEDAGSISIVNNGSVIAYANNDETGQGAILATAQGDISIVSSLAISNADVVDEDDESATIQAISQVGDVTITAGQTITNGGSMYGIHGHSGLGDVTINAGTTLSYETEMTGNYTAEGILGTSDAGNVSITADVTQVQGYAASAIIGHARGPGSVTIVSDTASAVSGGTIFGVSEGGDVSITTTGDTTTLSDGAIIGRGGNVTVSTGAGTLTSAGEGLTQAVAIDATGDGVLDNAGTVRSAGSEATVEVNAGGTATITSLEAINLGTGPAILATGTQGVSITADTATVAASTGAGVSGSSSAGDVVLDIGSVTGSAAGSMVQGMANAGAVTITADDVLNTSVSPNSAGITATAGGGVNIVAGNVEAEGQAIRAVTATWDSQGNPVIPLNEGHVSIETTGAVTSRSWNAISINGNVASFDVTVGADSVVTGNGGSAVIAGGARLGDIDVTNNGLIVMQGAGESGIGVTATGAGNVTVTSNEIRVSSEAAISNVYTAGAISAVAHGGNVSVTSALATVSGPDRYGITASATGAGTVSIVSGTLSNDADDRAGIQALSEQGAITIDSTTLTTSGTDAYGIYASSNGAGDIAIISDTLTHTGSGNGISAFTDGTVRVISSALTVDGPDSWGIQAYGNEGAYVLTGDVASSGIGVIAQSQGVTDVHVDGAVVSANAEGMLLFGPNISVTVDEGASITGGFSGLVTAGQGNGSTAIVNAGTITGGTDVAIRSFGQTTLANSGTIVAGQSGVAVQLDDMDDIVILQSGSSVTGVIDTGGGLDSVRLNGTQGGTLAQFVNAETLDVNAGLWTTGDTANSFQRVTIASGAELQLDLTAGGLTGIQTPEATVEGTLTLDYADLTEAAEVTELALGGGGIVRLTGAGEVLLGNSASTFTGTTQVENGTLSLAGDLGGNVVTSGAGIFRITDGSAFTGNLLNDGTFIYDRTDSYTMTGDFSGAGLMVKNGDGVLTFGGLYDFAGTTTINGGLVNFVGQLGPQTVLDLQQGTVDLSALPGSEHTIAGLSGSADGTLELGSTLLNIDQSANTTFGGTITGTGGLNKTGAGVLDLTGTSTYSGFTQVNGGTLRVNGALTNSAVIVNDGGQLGGNGIIAGLVVQAGGVAAPGNSIGQLTVNGDVTFAADSTYLVEVNAAGDADRIDATGIATLDGGTVQVEAEAGDYRGRTTYTILTAQGGVDGTFDSVTSNFAFLTPGLSYDATSVMLTLTRNDMDFAALATTPNGRAVGAALQALGVDDPLFEEALFLSEGEVQPAFASLSGEIYPAFAAGLMEDAQMLRRSLLGQPVREDAGAFGWATLLGSWGKADATAGTAKLSTDQKGVMGGIGFAGNGLNAALGIGRIAADYSGLGHADVDSTVVAGTLRYAANGFSGAVGVSYAWHDIDVTRSATLGTIANSLVGKADGSTRQVFGEIGYGLETGGFALTPFAGIAYVETRRDALTETGGALALSLTRDKRHATYADLGLRIAGKPGAGNGADGADKLGLAPYASAAWRRAWGDRGAAMQASIGGTAGAFEVVGPVISRDAADLAAGVVASLGALRLSVGYEGLVSSGWTNHSGQMRFSIAF
ncbi:autotransporter domain-containing protein [Novosphingobium guangzhouense]|uniref:Autotransporter domain-containing protein n=1 Tax=Novosphingobium guangzhouense TaxID=1850347 RepID=A0A2K2G135_9SPHN|nr:autotransporter domain-containing protein [Novosphingobium guangzhouense]PNU04756.1 hypothetical protein A8V01_18530 [Novosphingobium guangzhouense]